jgi:hypothetical protein
VGRKGWRLTMINMLLSSLDRPLLFIASFFLAIPFYFMTANLFFDGWDDFLENLRYLYQPWWLSALRGEYYEDQWSGVKMLFFIICCISFLILIYKLGKMFF